MERRGEIGLDDPVPRLGVHVERGDLGGDAGGVDQDVNRPDLGSTRVAKPRQRVLVGGIDADPQRTPPQRFNRGGHFIDQRCPAPGRDHVGAGAGERQRGRRGRVRSCHRSRLPRGQ